MHEKVLLLQNILRNVEQLQSKEAILKEIASMLEEAETELNKETEEMMEMI